MMKSSLVFFNLEDANLLHRKMELIDRWDLYYSRIKVVTNFHNAILNFNSIEDIFKPI